MKPKAIRKREQRLAQIDPKGNREQRRAAARKARKSKS
jgi:hypothetical protein